MITASSGYEHYLAGAGAHAALDLRGKTIVLDTNILLGLYALHDDALAEVTRSLSLVQSQLFLPAQVQREFWRNRDAVLRRSRDSSRNQSYEQAQRDAEGLVTRAQSRGLTAAERKAWKQKIKEFFADLRSGLHDAALGTRAERALTHPSSDPVVGIMDVLFAGRVGAAPTADEERVIRTHFEQRCLAKTPPGYMDAEKADGGFGDYAVWTEVIAHARVEGRPVVLVTNDLKEDWWRLHRTGDPINARFELVQEMGAEACVGFDMLTFSQFLGRLEQLAGADFAESTFDEVDSVPSSIAIPDDEPHDSPQPIWIVEQLALLIFRLRDQGFTPQADVLLEAARTTSGQLDRAELLSLLGRAPDEKITGFTRSILTTQSRLELEGLLPPGLPPALTPEYDRPGKAQRFAVPAELAGAARGIDI